MIIELIVAVIVGILAGTVTGLAPGIHVNLVAPLAIFASLYFSFLSPTFIVVFIVAMSVTHTFIDFIPSVYLGAPDEDTGLSVLPGHSFLLDGRGHEAVVYTLYGSLIGLIIFLILTPFFIFILPVVEDYLRYAMFLILISASFYLVWNETKNKLFALLIFLLSGFLGLAAFNLNFENSLLPLLTGLFGSSSLVISIMEKHKMPEQIVEKIKNIKLKKDEIKNSFIASALSAPLCAFLPSLSSGQAAAIGSDLTGNKGEKENKKEFLTLLGAINTIVMTLSFVTLYAIGKSRTGSAVFIDKILDNFSFSMLLIIIFSALFSGVFAFFIALKISRFFAYNINKINYKKISFFVLIFLFIVVFFITGFIGVLVFLVSTFLGISAILFKVRRISLIGSLMFPTILLYLPF